MQSFSWSELVTDADSSHHNPHRRRLSTRMQSWWSVAEPPPSVDTHVDVVVSGTGQLERISPHHIHRRMPHRAQMNGTAAATVAAIAICYRLATRMHQNVEQEKAAARLVIIETAEKATIEAGVGVRWSAWPPPTATAQTPKPNSSASI